ncbi:MAG: HAD family hydrolase [Acidobacteriota bacterium]|nr:HAD family hydrolase [Acidobacteriota bacterium]
MEPRLVLFDIDGTLVDTAGAGRHALVEALRRMYDIDGDVELSRRVKFEGKTDPIIVVELAEVFGIETQRVKDQVREFERLYLEILGAILARPDERRRVLPGVIPLLDALSERPDTHVGLLTGNIEAGGRAKLASLDLERYFEAGGFASDHPDRRVIARIAREKMERSTGLFFDPERTVVVGDTHHDVECARANGFRVVAVNSGYVPRETLVAAGPDALFDDLSDLDAVLRALEV